MLPRLNPRQQSELRRKFIRRWSLPEDRGGGAVLGGDADWRTWNRSRSRAAAAGERFTTVPG